MTWLAGLPFWFSIAADTASALNSRSPCARRLLEKKETWHRNRNRNYMICWSTKIYWLTWALRFKKQGKTNKTKKQEQEQNLSFLALSSWNFGNRRPWLNDSVFDCGKHNTFSKTWAKKTCRWRSSQNWRRITKIKPTRLLTGFYIWWWQNWTNNLMVNLLLNNPIFNFYLLP